MRNSDYDPDYVDRLVEPGIDRASCDIEIDAPAAHPDASPEDDFHR
jgi:hypothetical protein